MSKHIQVQFETHRSHLSDFERWMMKFTLLGIGLLIGAAVALYWSVNNIQPLQPSQTIYLNGVQR